MSTLLEVRNQIKRRLNINNTTNDVIIDDEIRTAIRQLQGKPYWFLRTANNVFIPAGTISILVPADFSSLHSADFIQSNKRYFKHCGFDLMIFERLRSLYWTSEPIMEKSNPDAYSVVNNQIYFSHKVSSNASLFLDYYKKDVALPSGASSTSVFFQNEAFDVVVEVSKVMFEFRSLGGALDNSLVNSLIQKLDGEHERRVMEGRL